MATNRPSLEVQAQPVNTFTAPVAAAAQMYDQASVRYALQLSDAFREFSTTAAGLASSIKKDLNKEELQAGMQTVRENQMSYAELVQQGKIKPSENPWMAVGAQQASGALMGTKARAELYGMVERQAAADPKFFDSPDPFNALVSSYAANKAQEMNQSPFESKAFFESLDPYVSTLRLHHEDKMIETQKQKVAIGVGAAVANGIDDFISPDANVSGLSVKVLQEKIDEMGRLGALSQTEINRLVVDNFVGLMAQGDNSEKAQQLFESLDSAPGMKLSKTEYAMTQMSAARGKIEANRNRLSGEEAKVFQDEFMGPGGVVDQVVGGKMTAEEAQQKFYDFSVGPSRRISITGGEYEQKNKAIITEIEKRKTQAEHQREIDNHNTVLEMATNGSQNLPAGYSETEAYNRLVDQTETTMVDMNMTESQKIQIRNYRDQIWTKNEKMRAENRFNESQQVLWEGTGTTPGLLSTTNAAVSSFMSAPAGAIPDPEVSKWKASVDSWIETIGERPDSNSEAVKSVYKNAVTRFDGVIQNYEEHAKALPAFRGTLAPLPDDGVDIRAQKANVRARASALRMQIGQQFNDHKESSRLSRILLTKIGPAIENSVPYDLEDALGAYVIARQNNYPMSAVVGPSPDSPIGKELISRLDWATNQILTTHAQPADVLKDMARMEFFGKANKLNLFDMTNPLDLTDMNTKGSDAKEFAASYSNTIAPMKMTNPDANLYPLTVWRNAYMESLKSTLNPKQALADAEKAVTEQTIPLRGSVVPANMVARQAGARPTPLDETYLTYWLDAKFPGKDATLVVVSLNPDGSPLLAVRDSKGNSVDGAKGLYTPDDFALKPEMLRSFNAVEQRRKIEIQKRENHGPFPDHPFPLG